MVKKPIICATIGHDTKGTSNGWRKTEYLRKAIKSSPTNLRQALILPPTRPITNHRIQSRGYEISIYIGLRQIRFQKNNCIVSPGNFEDMVNYPRACKAKGID